MATPEELANLNAVVPDAQLTAKVFGVPASVTLAQWITESSWGKSTLAVKANNCFGVKYSQKNAIETYVEMPTAEYENGQRTIVQALFVKYVTVGDSFKGHASLLSKAARYKPAMAVAHDPAAFAEQLQRCGYSTNPHYGDQLVQLMRLYNLTQYDVPPPTEPAAQLEAA